MYIFLFIKTYASVSFHVVIAQEYTMYGSILIYFRLTSSKKKKYNKLKGKIIVIIILQHIIHIKRCILHYQI